MAKKAAGLTARRVLTEARPGLHGDGGGLYLQVAPTGSKSWILRYQLRGRRRDMGLGAAGLFSLADAREKAVAARRLVAEGIDPIADRKAREAARLAAEDAAEKASKTFRQCAEGYIAAQRAGWRNPKHAAQWASTLETYAYPVLGDMPMASIDPSHIKKVLAPIWETKTETASRLRGRIEAIFDSAKAETIVTGDNPAAWQGNVKHFFPAKGKVKKVEHHAALPYADLPAFWPKLQGQDGMGARALELAILTATRSGEVLGARWEEIDLDGATWTVPGDRMKAGLEHRIPLSGPALALLRRLAAIRTGDLVLPGQGGDRPLSNMTMTACLRRMKAGVTAHGFRSSFRTWASEISIYPSDVAEAALAHSKGKLTASYQRGDLFEKRRELMAAWASYVEGRGADVVPIKRRKRG
jgi:integrase